MSEHPPLTPFADFLPDPEAFADDGHAGDPFIGRSLKVMAEVHRRLDGALADQIARRADISPLAFIWMELPQ